MKPVDFDFLAPGSLAETLAALADGDAEASKLLAGGQSLMPMLNLRLARPARVIDIRRLPELLRVRDDGDGLVYGAGITHAAVEDGRVPDATPGWLPAVARGAVVRVPPELVTLPGPYLDRALIELARLVRGAHATRAPAATAVTHAPLTAILIVYEMTGEYKPGFSSTPR